MELLAAQTKSTGRNFLSGLLRDPLLHFLIAGALVFAIYDKFNPVQQSAETVAQIVLSKDDVFQLTKRMLAEGTIPDKRQLNELIEYKVNEEILFREALALGLHKNDDTVRRKVAGKMDFLIGDMTGLKEPASSELRILFDKDPARFSIPPRISLHQITFAADKPGARGRALAALEKINGSTPNLANQYSSTAPCDFEGSVIERTTEELVKEHGSDFAKTVERLSPGTWQGPIWSERGWNIVFVHSIEPSQPKAFEEVLSRVTSAWLDERQRETKRTVLESMRAHYSVTAPAFEIY